MGFGYEDPVAMTTWSAGKLEPSFNFTPVTVVSLPADSSPTAVARTVPRGCAWTIFRADLGSTRHRSAPGVYSQNPLESTRVTCILPPLRSMRDARLPANCPPTTTTLGCSDPRDMLLTRARTQLRDQRRLVRARRSAARTSFGRNNWGVFRCQKLLRLTGTSTHSFQN